jgi:hypothetical protein
MAGADVVVTSSEVADLVLQYAKHLGRAVTTDVVTIPIVRDGQAQSASLLLGPASQIAVVDEGPGSEEVELTVDEAVTALRLRIDAIAGGVHRTTGAVRVEPMITAAGVDADCPDDA